MDSNWFQETLANAGTSQAELARRLGLAPSAVSRMIKGDRQMKLQEAVEVAAFLGVSQEEVLRHAGAETPPRLEPARRGRPVQRDQLPSTAIARDRIPIRAIGAFGEPVGSTLRPANLSGVRDAYALYMTGEELLPRYDPGWLLHIHPFKPPTRGRDVVVVKHDRTLVFGQFVEWEADSLALRQLNPERTLRIPRAEIGECHLIVGVDQEG
jgi:transcriptional regulator with XRE-family HTH domain